MKSLDIVNKQIAAADKRIADLRTRQLPGIEEEPARFPDGRYEDDWEAVLLLPDLQDAGWSMRHSASKGLWAIWGPGHKFIGSAATQRKAGDLLRRAVNRAAKVAGPGRGGKREGSGRKSLDETGQTVITSVRLTATQRATLDMLGGVQWLRELLDGIAAGKVQL